MKKELTPKLFKHFSKITKYSGTSREALQCVYYDKDGSLTVTDSFRLIRLNNFHSHEESILQNLQTMEIKNDLSYPNTNKLIPEIKEDSFQIKIDANELKRALKSTANSKMNITQMEIKQNHVELQSRADGETLRVIVEANIKHKNFDLVAFNNSYMNDALMFATDLMPRLGEKIVTIYLQDSHVKPILVTTDKTDYLYLLTPIRTH